MNEPQVECDRKLGGVDWPGLGRTLLATTCVAFVYPIMELARGGSLTFASFFRDFLAAEIFGACIGTLANFVPWRGIASRLVSVPMKWLVHIATLLGLPAVGTPLSGVLFLLIGLVGSYGPFFIP